MWRTIFHWVEEHERHVSALAMVAGFVADNIFFERVDLWQTQALLGLYALACALAIPFHHYLESRGSRARLRILLPLTTQFALGGFWSAFVIFYGRSAVFGASWPFLLFLVLILLGSEYFHRYHARLVFTSVLFFFALYLWALFEVPLLTGTIGAWTFVVSSAAAVACFALFTILLRLVARRRFAEDVWRIRVGAFFVLAVMSLFYVFDVLPPLPLSSHAAGVYHEVTHVPGAYLGRREPQSFSVRYLGFAPTLHVREGETVYAYSAVYAPAGLTTTIRHRWQWYDPLTHVWVTRALVPYPIVGGREAGYRGYSNARMTSAGSWRVRIETQDGRLIEQLPYTIIFSAATFTEETLALP